MHFRFERVGSTNEQEMEQYDIECLVRQTHLMHKQMNSNLTRLSTYNKPPNIDIPTLERLAAALTDFPVAIGVRVGHDVAAIATSESADVGAEATCDLAAGRAEAGGHATLSFAEAGVELRELHGVHFALEGEFRHGALTGREEARARCRSLCPPLSCFSGLKIAVLIDHENVSKAVFRPSVSLLVVLTMISGCR